MKQDEFMLYTLRHLITSDLTKDKDFKSFLRKRTQKYNSSMHPKYQEVYDSIKKQFKEFKKTGIAPKKKLRGLVEGVFDMPHFGHFNLLRRAKKICDEVVVLINSDASVKKAKGPTVYNEEERKTILLACKWVKEVYIIDTYYVEVQHLDEFKCDFLIHGDDLIRDSNGYDIYQKFKELNKFRVCKRTHGISTTDIVHKILNIDNENFKNVLQKDNQFYHNMLNFINFSVHKRKKQGQIVYVSGSFDMINPGHVKFLKKAYEMGDYLIIGVFSNKTIQSNKGKNYPILDLNSRCLNLMSLKYFDDIIFDPPFEITQNFLKFNNIDIVVEGESNYLNDKDNMHLKNISKKTLLRKISSQSFCDFKFIKTKIDGNAEYYQANIQKKLDKLKDYYKSK